MARISCQSQLISDAWRANLATNWQFSRPRPLSGCMERKTFHGLPPGNAPWRNIATDRHPRTHRTSILPLPVRLRAHQSAILSPSDAGERIAREYCHRRMPKSASREHFAIGEAPENASRHNLAMTGNPKMYRGNTLPRQPPSRMLLDDISPRRPSTAQACCEIAVVPRSRKTPPKRNVGQFNNAHQHVQETMKIFWYLSLRNGTKNALA